MTLPHETCLTLTDEENAREFSFRVQFDWDGFCGVRCGCPSVSGQVFSYQPVFELGLTMTELNIEVNQKPVQISIGEKDAEKYKLHVIELLEENLDMLEEAALSEMTAKAESMVNPY